MPSYLAFGGVLASDVDLLELPPVTAESTPDWRITIAPAGANVPEGRCIGEEEVNAVTSVRCIETRDGMAVVFDDTGTFEVRAGGREIIWHRPAGGVKEAAVREDVLGRVLSIALHEAGLFCLHASAVAVDGRGIAFLAPKYHGKSSLCLELTRQGARFLTDDMLPVRLTSEARLLPGVPRVRLWRDAVEHFAVADGDVAPDSKRVLSFGEIDDHATGEVPFSAAYLLTPVNELTDGLAVRRERLAPSASALALLGMGKVTGLLGKERSIDSLQMASRISELVPIYQLFVVRDYARLGEVASTIAEWTRA